MWHMAGGEGVVLETTEEREAIALYQRALLVKAFPGYTFETIGEAPARRVMQAARLLDIAARLPAPGSGSVE